MRTKIDSFFPPRLRSARTIFNYYKRYVDIFFTKPILLKDSSGHVRSYICDAMRRFAEWYDQRYGDAEVRLLIDEIIKRYDLKDSEFTIDFGLETAKI